MIIDPNAMPKVLQLYLEISQYPILASIIRQRMRQELFSRGIINQEDFEIEVREKAIASQEREGVISPVEEEPGDVWDTRLSRIRDHLTDFYFAYNLHHDLFQEIVTEAVSARAPEQKVLLSFNPELAPWDLLFKQGEAYENLPPEERATYEHHLREIIVVLIKAMISDQLSFVRVARKYFTVRDLTEIRTNRIGRGKIGGKAAGMLLAYKVLQRHAAAHDIDPERITIPDSWFLGSDVYYNFHASNNLFHLMNQKYRRPEQMREDYPQLYNTFLNSRLPEEVADRLADLLRDIGKVPVIVRSSSLLEDNFDTSFAGKYDSFFLPNQGTPKENLRDLCQAIIRIYASVIRPEALIYRDMMNLIDYDERMAILIQRVEGQHHGPYYFPDFAGVGFSHNPYPWSKRIRVEDGLVRMVLGLGTRAVDRVGNDYPRMVALSHPTLRPESNARMIRHYSQQMMDVLNLEENRLESLPIHDVIDGDFMPLGAIMSQEADGYYMPLNRRPLKYNPGEMVVTFDRLLADREFVHVIRESMEILEKAYNRPVDIEFAGEILAAFPRPQVRFSLLQCRPLSQRKETEAQHIPDDIADADILFTANEQVPSGIVEDIRYIIYVDPDAYADLADPVMKIELGRVIGRLNAALAGEVFILMGPGRWGSSNIQLGVSVNYGDIYNTRMLIEIASRMVGGSAPEVSYGTHFFQDLVEANIHPLPLYPDDRGVIFRAGVFRDSPNSLGSILPADSEYERFIRVIDIPEVFAGRLLTIIMNGKEERAVAFLTSPTRQRKEVI